MLNLKEMEKYSRQTILPLIGIQGQEKLFHCKITIVGIGALGTTTSQLLIRAGVKNITLIDPDIIEESNLQRQTLFNEEDLGKYKAETAGKKLKEINSLAKIRIIKEELSKPNMNLLRNSDLILDCTDNLTVRMLINDFCKKEKITWIYSSCVKTAGYVMSIFPQGPCLRCFLNEVNLDTACTAGIINTIAISISALQVTLAIKIIIGKNIKANLFYYNIWEPKLREFKIKKNCKLCSEKS